MFNESKTDKIFNLLILSISFVVAVGWFIAFANAPGIGG